DRATFGCVERARDLLRTRIAQRLRSKQRDHLFDAVVVRDLMDDLLANTPGRPSEQDTQARTTPSALECCAGVSLECREALPESLLRKRRFSEPEIVVASGSLVAVGVDQKLSWIDGTGDLLPAPTADAGDVAFRCSLRSYVISIFHVVHLIVG